MPTRPLLSPLSANNTSARHPITPSTRNPTGNIIKLISVLSLKETCQKSAIFGHVIPGYPGVMCPVASRVDSQRTPTKLLTSAPVVTSQILTIVEEDNPLATRCPSGENATVCT